MFSRQYSTHTASCLAICCRCWLSSEGGEHHSRELVNRGSGAGRAASFPGSVTNIDTHTRTIIHTHPLASLYSLCPLPLSIVKIRLLPSSVEQLIHYFFFVLRTFVCCRVRLPSLAWRCLRSRFVLVIKYFIPTVVLLY